MSLNAPTAVNAIVSPGNVPGLRKLLVKLTLMRAGNAADMEDEVNTSNLADDLEIPSSLASIGKFVRLSEVAEVAKGSTGIKDARPGPYPLVVTAEERGSCDHYDFDGEAVLIPTVSSTGHGDASLKRIHYQEGRFAVGSILAAVQVRDQALHSTRFLYEYLSVFKDELLVARMSGTANVSLTVKKIEGVPIPLVPIAQQRHLHDLMRLCDALEAKGQLQAEQHARLLGTLLGTLTDSSTPEELAANWQRVADHFDLLLDRPEAVDALEQTILQLAVRGLLVPQDPRDEPANLLTVRIQAAKTRLVAAGLAKVDKSVSPVSAGDDQPALPGSWQWVRLADLCSVITDGEHVTPERCDDPNEVPLVTAKNVRSEAMDYAQTDYVPRDIAERCWRRCKPQSGDILMVSVGATLGRLAVLRDAIDMVIVRSVTMIRPVPIGVNVEYLALHLMSPISQSEIWASVKQSAQPCLYLAKSSALRIALPPLAEQVRIVARVSELRRLCGDLRQHLAARQVTQTRLAEALVDSAIP